MEIKYIVSYGGGVDSTAMIIHMLQHNVHIDYVVFADTGAELPETYKTVKKMTRYLKKRGIELIVVKPGKDRSLQDRCEDRNVTPDRLRRWCTRDVKITPIFAFYRKLQCKIVQYIGIDASETRRVKADPKDWILNSYYLVDQGIDREECLKINKKNNFGEVIKSGCYFCIYNRIDRWYWLYQDHLDMYNEAMKFEEQSKHFPRQTLFPGTTLRILAKSFKKGIIPDMKNKGDAF